jgi:hypothetical protein
MPFARSVEKSARAALSLFTLNLRTRRQRPRTGGRCGSSKSTQHGRYSPRLVADIIREPSIRPANSDAENEVELLVERCGIISGIDPRVDLQEDRQRWC